MDTKQKNKIKQLRSPISPSAWPGPIPSLRTRASCFPAACLLHMGLGRGHELPEMLGATRASAGITHQVAPPRRVEVGFHVISDRGSEHGAVGLSRGDGPAQSSWGGVRTTRPSPEEGSSHRLWCSRNPTQRVFVKVTVGAGWFWGTNPLIQGFGGWPCQWNGAGTSGPAAASHRQKVGFVSLLISQSCSRGGPCVADVPSRTGHPTRTIRDAALSGWCFGQEPSGK